MDSSRRIPELDGLRGIAIGMVIIWHYLTGLVQARPGTVVAYMLATTRLAWTGVDLFFVLSGFLIGGILLDARNSTNYFRVFYRRRFFRIFPVYALILLIFPGISFLRHLAHPGLGSLAAGSSPPWYMYWTFTQNFWMAAASSLGTNSLGMTWSLAVEEQFYLTLPLVIFFVGGIQLRKIVLVGIVVAPVLRIALHFISPQNWGAAFVLMPCRADSLLLGVLAAMLLRDAIWSEKIQNDRRFFNVAIPVLLLGILFLNQKASRQDYPLMATVGYSWVGFFYAIVLVYVVTRPASRLARVLRVSWLRWLGSIAYGTYLFHIGMLILAFRLFSPGPPRITGFHSLFVILIALVLTLVVARLSWNYFEKPLVKIGHRTNYDFESDSHFVEKVHRRGDL
jgi:peptidoglycan/LPS O-acetylase OafA/YrhL